MIPVVFCLQVCPYDAQSAIELCALIADLQGKKRNDLEFWVVHRRDTPRGYIEWMNESLHRAFERPYFFSAPNFADGFPMGCNLLWNSTMLLAGTARTNGLTHATGILTFEPDCVPLSSDWMDALADEWQAAHAEVVGNLVGEGEGQHINGNAMFRIDLLQRYPELGAFGWNQAWDTYHAELLTRIGKNTDLIAQDYQIANISEEELFKPRKGGVVPALFHGVKDGSARTAVRTRFGL